MFTIEDLHLRNWIFLTKIYLLIILTLYLNLKWIWVIFHSTFLHLWLNRISKHSHSFWCRTLIIRYSNIWLIILLLIRSTCNLCIIILIISLRHLKLRYMQCKIMTRQRMLFRFKIRIWSRWMIRDYSFKTINCIILVHWFNLFLVFFIVSILILHICGFLWFVLWLWSIGMMFFA